MIRGVTFVLVFSLLGLLLMAGRTVYWGPEYFPDSLYAVAPCEPGRWSDDGTAWPPWPSMDDFEAEWYGRHLSAAEEQPIFESATPVLRFTWLRSFHPSVIVRVDTEADGEMQLTATELSGRGGYDPGVVARREHRPLTLAEREDLQRAIDASGLHERAETQCDFGLDGARWILETAGPNGYRYVNRWSPEEGPVYDLGLHLIGLTGWTHDEIY